MRFYLDFALYRLYNPGIKIYIQRKEGEMENTLFLLLYWTGPIGIGIFLLCLGAMIYLLTKADEVSKRTKAFAQEKGLDKKRA